jgi:hypothetical protein
MASLNAPTQKEVELANEVIGQIRTRIRSNSQIRYHWYEYESDVNRILESFLPQCVLSGVKLLFFLSNVKNSK